MPITERDAQAAAIALKKLRGKASYRVDAERDAEYCETLKKYAEETGERFKHDDKWGEVSVSKPSKSEFKGLVYELIPEMFLALDLKERAKLQEGPTAMVREVAKYSEERRASITVRLPD